MKNCKDSASSRFISWGVFVSFSFLVLINGATFISALKFEGPLPDKALFAVVSQGGGQHYRYPDFEMWEWVEVYRTEPAGSLKVQRRKMLSWWRSSSKPIDPPTFDERLYFELHFGPMVAISQGRLP